MRLDEEIKHYEEVAKLKEYRVDEEKEIAYARLKASTDDMRPMAEIEKLNRDAERYRQLAEWLKELKEYRKIISELSEAMHWYDGCERCQGFREYPTSDFVDGVRSYVKQFEEVNADEDSD